MLGLFFKFSKVLKSVILGTQQRQLLSRLQIDPVMAETLQISQGW